MGYCNKCGACGESGCCSPLVCDQESDGDYCKGYLHELKSAYMTLTDLYEWLCKDREKHKDIIDKINEIEDENDNFNRS